jgi:hypothetical protein
VGTQITNLVDSSPSALNTLNELAAALGDDANFSTTVTNSIALKAPIASPTFTGFAKAPYVRATSEGDIALGGISGISRIQSNASNDIRFLNSSNQDLLTLVASTRAATFAGNVTVNGGQILTPSGVNLALNPNTGIVSVGGVIQASGTGNNTFAGTGTFTDAITANGSYPGLVLNSTSHTRFAITNRYSSNYVTFDMTPQGGSTLEALTLKNNGNLGIGTATPQTTLEVKGAASALNAHFGQGTNNSSGVFGGISLGYSEANTSYRKVGIVAQTKGDNSARQDLHFLVDTVNDQNSAGVGDSKMHIQYNTGDVIINNKLGIGTTAPSETLQVNGNIRVAGVGNAIGFDTTGANLSNGIKTINDYETVIYNGRGSAGHAVIGNSNIRLGFGANYTASQASLFITSTGNVGIGTSSPSYKLEVNGGTALVGGGFYVSSDQSVSTNFTYTFRDAVGINNPNSISATANAGYTMCVGRSHDSGSGVSGSISAVGTIRASAFTTGINTTAGIGGSNGDVNAAEIGPGYLNLSRDDTAGAQQIRFEKNGALHSYIETTTSGLNIGNANVYLAKSTNQGQLFFGTADNQYEIFGGGNWGYMGYNTSGYHRFFGSGTERMRITNAGLVGIGENSPVAQLDVQLHHGTGAFNKDCGARIGRIQYAWHTGQYYANNSYSYVHYKTNLWMGGSHTNSSGYSGNTHYIMGGFYIKSYKYGSLRGDGTVQFHNWSGGFAGLTVQNSGNWTNFVQSPYTSSDGFCVIVLAHNYYSTPNIDFHQSFTAYPWRNVQVTASSQSNSTTGVY